MEFTQTKCSWQHSNSVKEDFNVKEVLLMKMGDLVLIIFYCLKDCKSIKGVFFNTVTMLP